MWALFTWAATIIALTGTVLNCKKVRACFWFWAVTNVMWLAWDVSSGLWARAVLDVVQFALATWGLHEWGKTEA